MSLRKLPKFKICGNPQCGEKFYRRSRELPHHWKRRVYCKRFCQTKAYALAKGKTRTTDTSYTAMHDCLNKLMEDTRDRIAKTVITYSSKKFSQEELYSLIPSEKAKKC